MSGSDRVGPARRASKFHPCNSVPPLNHEPAVSNRYGARCGQPGGRPQTGVSVLAGRRDRSTICGMSILPDPAELLGIADRISTHAGAVRARAHQLGRAAATSGWSGPAAEAFRLEADDTIAALHGAAGRLDDAADALRRHAARVRHVVELLHVLEHQAIGLVHGAEHGMEHGVEHSIDGLARVADLVGI
jgi:uncharacterized protein YukE